MTTPSFIQNVNLLVKNINSINSLATSLDAQNVEILQQLLNEINLVPIIEDLEKGLYHGNRQIRVNLLENYLNYNESMTDEEKEALYLDLSEKPEYRGVTLYLTDNTSKYIPFTQDGVTYNIGTNTELYEFLLNDATVQATLDNTILVLTPAPAVSLELIISDVDNTLSNLIKLDLVSVDSKGAVETPIYDWVSFTSTLQLLAQHFSALQVLAFNMEDVLAVPEENQAIVDEMQNLATELENTINRIILMTADPSMANVGEVLTVEVVNGEKVGIYKPIADVGGFKMTPAVAPSAQNPTGTLGGVIPSTGFSVTAEGLMTIDEDEFTQPVTNHNDDPNAHKDHILKLIPDANASTKGIMKLSNSTTSNAVDTAASSSALKTVNDRFSINPLKAGQSPVLVTLPDGTLGFEDGWGGLLGSSGTGKVLGEIFTAVVPYGIFPEGAVKPDGATYTKGLFPDVYQAILDNKVLNLPITEYEAQITEFGRCIAFGIDTTAQTFRVPLLQDGVAINVAMSELEYGKSYKAGLPNITGSIVRSDTVGLSSNPDSTLTNGAFDVDVDNELNMYPATANGAGYPIRFNASRSNPTYGNSTTVQTEQVRLPYFVQIVNGSTNASLIDWQEFMSALQGKANLDLSNATPQEAFATTLDGVGIRTVVETWRADDNTTWYRKWSDGFIEQGGNNVGKSGSYGQTTTLPYPFQSVVLTALLAPKMGSYGGSVFSIGVRCTLTELSTNNSPAGSVSYWYACGY